MKRANKPVTIDEIIDNSGLTKDFWLIKSILNQLKLFGVIEEYKEGLEKRKYVLSSQHKI